MPGQVGGRARSPGVLIAFSGADAAGKSIQIGLLSSDLSRQGIASKVLWHRPGYSPMLDAVRATIRRSHPGALPPPGESRQRQEAFSRPTVQRTWIVVALIDTILHLSRVRWLLARGLVVICDRYVEDWMLDLALHFPQLNAPSWPLARLTRSIAPRPAASLLLCLGWEEVTRRASDKDEPFPDPPEIRRKRFDAYEQLATSGRFKVIDADQPVESVHEDVVAILNPLTRCP